MARLRYSWTAIAIAFVLFGAQAASAQSQSKQGRGQQSGASTQQSAKQPAEQGGGSTVQTRDYGSEQQTPEPPGQGDLEAVQQSTQNIEVAENAGVGSPVAYASESILELGGTFALTHASDTTTFRIAPTLGYFFVDNLELTLAPELQVVDVSGETDVIFGVMLEPSYHMPLSKRVFAFLGVGFGIGYAQDPGVDFALRPKLGMDFLIGRSGILKPAAFLDIGTNEGLTAGGVEAGFTILL